MFSQLLREFGLYARRVRDESAQARADELWSQVGPRLSARASLEIDCARAKARRAYLMSTGSKQDIAVIAANVQQFMDAIDAATRRAVAVEKRRGVARHPQIMRLVSPSSSGMECAA